MYKKSVVVFAVIASLMCLPGCNNTKIEEIIKNNKDSIVKGIAIVAEQGTAFGLKKWAKDNPGAAKEAAAALAKNIKDELVPYFSGDGKLAASSEVSEIINSSLFKNVPDEVRIAIVSAAAILDVYLPAPDSSTYLNADHVDYIKAFLGGVAKAADKLAGTETWSIPDNKWIK